MHTPNMVCIYVLYESNGYNNSDVVKSSFSFGVLLLEILNSIKKAIKTWLHCFLKSVGILGSTFAILMMMMMRDHQGANVWGLLTCSPRRCLFHHPNNEIAYHCTFFQRGNVILHHKFNTEPSLVFLICTPAYKLPRHLMFAASNTIIMITVVPLRCKGFFHLSCRGCFF